MKRNYIIDSIDGIKAVSLPAGTYPCQERGWRRTLVGPIYHEPKPEDMATAQSRAREWGSLV